MSQYWGDSIRHQASHRVLEIRSALSQGVATGIPQAATKELLITLLCWRLMRAKMTMFCQPERTRR
jgi:hypothetical protein